MKNIISVLWGSNASCRLSDPFRLVCDGDEAGRLMDEKLHIACLNPALRSLFADSNFGVRETIVHLIGISDGQRDEGLRLDEYVKPSPRQLLLFAHRHGRATRGTLIVFPELFNGNPIVLCVDNGTSLLCNLLLCSPPVAQLKGRNLSILVAPRD